MKQAKIWNMGLTETPHRIANDIHEDIVGLLFAWRQQPKLKGLLILSDKEKEKLSEAERRCVTRQEKVALIVLMNPLPSPRKRKAAEVNKEAK